YESYTCTGTKPLGTPFSTHTEPSVRRMLKPPSTCPMLFITVVIFAWIASTVMASRSRTFAALTVRRSMNASLEVNRSNRAVSTLSQLDLMIFDVMISELTLRKSAYMASMDIALTLLVNKFVLTISSIMAFSTYICLDLITFEPIISDVMTFD